MTLVFTFTGLHMFCFDVDSYCISVILFSAPNYCFRFRLFSREKDAPVFFVFSLRRNVFSVSLYV